MSRYDPPPSNFNFSHRYTPPPGGAAFGQNQIAARAQRNAFAQQEQAQQRRNAFNETLANAQATGQDPYQALTAAGFGQEAMELQAKSGARNKWALAEVGTPDGRKQRVAYLQSDPSKTMMLGKPYGSKESREPSFAEKQAIKGDQKRIDDLSKTSAARRAAIDKAQRFLDLFQGKGGEVSNLPFGLSAGDGKMASGAWRKAAGYIPGVWTQQGQLDEEFNAFAEIAARQALKASGEVRPTDADVKGMKEAMFGIGRDEGVNINLLEDYIRQQTQDEAEYQRLTGAQPTGLRPGTIQDGYVFMGGDASNPKSWKKVK